MPLILSRLTDHDPSDYIDTEIGCLAVFGLSMSSTEEIREKSRDLVDAEEFARLLAVHTCFPKGHLRDGRFKPSESVLTDAQISSLSQGSLESLDRVLLSKCFDQSFGDSNEDFPKILDQLMSCYHLRWQDSDRVFNEAIAKACGSLDQFETINQRIRSLPIPDASHLIQRPISERILPEIKEILLQMNDYSRSSSADSSAESKKTGAIAFWTLVVTIIAFLGSPPASRWTCILRANTFHYNLPALSGWVDAMCGFKGWPRSSSVSRLSDISTILGLSSNVFMDGSREDRVKAQKHVLGMPAPRVKTEQSRTAQCSPNRLA